MYFCFLLHLRASRVVCASGKSADEMLALLKARIDNTSSDEVRVAAEEHAKIADIRLGKLIEDS